ncbi:FMN-binding protein [Uniformispora flossi]|uniref:FMN-binding protein n=1 Tax=Uniformispora flossi TaxID=3390723 RepID=UPI003C2D5CF3
MRRAALTTVSSVAGIVLLLSLKPHSAAPITAATDDGQSGSSGNSSAAAPDSGTTGSSGGSSDSGGTGTGSGTTTAAGARDGTFTGSAISTRYGPVQVAVTLANGRITSVDVVQVPTRDRRDREINDYAVPQLTSETMDAQSAAIDAVSGATYTSQGYIRSLQNALDQAHA